MINYDLLVDEALKLFHKYGVKVTMDELASNLRISKRTLYEQIGNKENLISFIMDYFTERMDKYYDEILSRTDLIQLEKFKNLLSSMPQKIFFREKYIIELKAIYPDLYFKYIKKIDNRWDKLYSVLEEYLQTVPQVKIDKKIFRMTYMSTIEGIALYLEDNNDESFQKLVSQMTELILSGISTTSAITLGGMALPDLLSTLAVGVSLFNVKKRKLIPQYLSPGYLKLYQVGEITKDIELSEKIHPGDIDYFFKQFNDAIKNHAILSATYRIISNNELRWHRIKAVKLDETHNTFLAVIIDETETKQNEFNLRVSEERLKLAFEQISIIIWECDILKRTVKLSAQGTNPVLIENKVIENVPESLMTLGIVHPDSANAITSFYRKMFNGEKLGTCVAKVRSRDDLYIWTKLSFKTIFDDNNNPIRAVAISEKINNVVDVKSRFNQEESLLNLLSKELLLSVEINLTKDELVRSENSLIIPNLITNEHESYEQFYNDLLCKLIYEEEKQKFEELFRYDKIFITFESGKASTHLSFRCCKEDGQIFWVSYTVNIVAEPFTGDLFIFGYIRDIDVKMKLELSLSRKIEYDVTTRLYIASTTKKMTNLALMKEEKREGLCAFVLMEITNFAQIKRQFGLDVGEKVLFYIGRVLRICFNNKNIVGRILDNQFTIFFPKVVNPVDLKKRIDDAVSMAHNSYSLSTDDNKITNIRTSIIISKVGNANYDGLLYYADKKLNEIRNLSSEEHKDIIDNIEDFYNNVSDNGFDIYENSDNIVGVNSIDNKDILLDCTTALLSKESLKNSFNYILKRINEYYKGHCTFIIEFENEKQTVNCTYEHFQVESDLSIIFDHLDIKKIPNFMELVDGRHPIIINNAKVENGYLPLEINIINKANINSCYLAPLYNDNKVNGYVGVTNPNDHIGDVSLLQTLAFFINNELIRNRLEEKQRFLDEYDTLTQLRNHNAFRKRVAVLRNTMLSSLGVACFQINNLRQVNNDNGSDFGDSMILVVSQALKHQFRDLDLYRYEGEKFAVLCADINYHIFNDKIKKIMDEINGVNSGLVTFGHTWADNDIDVEKLIIHSEEIIFINKKDMFTNENRTIMINEKLINLVESMDKGWFEVFLQPKFDLDLNNVCGAEALIRMNHPLYGLISPVKMIPILEREKLVGYVDLFVLEQVCKTIQRWKIEGRKLYPIAVNYSRITLLEQGIIEKTVNILKKYNVSNDLIEIEITETIGNLEQRIISEMANRFVDANLRLAIDDFGSKFSSLSTLSLIPFNVVKLDKSIVNDLVINTRSQVIVEYVIMMCKKLGMKSVAEGIETEAQFKELKTKGCDYGQGYYFEKPIPIYDFEEKYNPKNN